LRQLPQRHHLLSDPVRGDWKALKESPATALELTAIELTARLERFYGPLPPPPSDPFRYYVWEALSIQTTAARRDAAYAALQRIPALTPDSMFRTPRLALVQAVAHAGPYQEPRLSALLGGVDRFRRNPQLGADIHGPLPRARRAVSLLPRLGDRSAHRLLLFGGGHRVLPVDRDVARLCVRLGLSGSGGECTPSARAVRRRVEPMLPRELAAFRRAALYLRHHALHTCTEDPHCPVCPLADVCPGKRPHQQIDAR
jgi:endonuclease III